MRKDYREMDTCQICRKKFDKQRLIPASSIRESLVALIVEDCPDWSNAGYICQSDLATYRGRRVERLLASERGELTDLENDVVNSLREHDLLAGNIEATMEQGLTFGQRLADKVAAFGGSWFFIVLFLLLIAIWIGVNSVALMAEAVDPYPYILLNLILSCIAAVQAPVIMMSQNRQDAKDRVRGRHEYQINLKAELEIRHLHEKMDHLLSHQWARMTEIQQLQLELLTDISNKSNRGSQR